MNHTLRFYCLLSLFFIGSICWGNVFTVTNSTDSGPGSLRHEVASANATPGPDTIKFSTATDGIPIVLTTGNEIDLLDSLWIIGNGMNQTVLDGDSTTRVFHVNPGARVFIMDLKVQNGRFPFINGGAILNNGTLLVQRCIFTNNRANRGGAIYSNAGLMECRNSHFINNQSRNCGGGISVENAFTWIYNCHFIKNSSSGDGGGLCSEFANTFVVNSFFKGNYSNGYGGGIEVLDTSIVSISGSIISGNTAAQQGGGVDCYQAGLILRNSTLSGNQETSGFGGGGLLTEEAFVSINNTIIAKNYSPTTSDFTDFGAIIFGAHNLIGDGTGQGSFVNGVNGNIVGTSFAPIDPVFVDSVSMGDSTSGDLRVQICSPAINAGTNDSLDITDTLDAFGNPRIADITVDIGAYEYTDPDPLELGFYEGCPESPPCFANVTIDQPYLDGIYQAAHTITISGDVQVMGDTKLRAREFIIDPVFQVPAGLTFVTELNPCSP